MFRKASTTVVAAALVVGSLWYVVAPPRSVDAYRERASSAAETVRSQVQTARIWLRTLARDDALRTSATVGLREAEGDAVAAASNFERYQPPRGTDALGAELSTLAADATTVLGDLRIAADRGEWAKLPRLGEPLPKLAGQLQALAAKAQP